MCRARLFEPMNKCATTRANTKNTKDTKATKKTNEFCTEEILFVIFVTFVLFVVPDLFILSSALVNTANLKVCTIRNRRLL
jgi:hypothetical protein